MTYKTFLDHNSKKCLAAYVIMQGCLESYTYKNTMSVCYVMNASVLLGSADSPLLFNSLASSFFPNFKLQTEYLVDMHAAKSAATNCNNNTHGLC